MKNTYVRVFSVLALVLLLLIGATVLGVADGIMILSLPFVLLGKGLRGLSLSSSTGNVIAIVIYVILSLCPLLLKIRNKWTKKDILIPISCAVMFYVVYYMINPGSRPIVLQNEVGNLAMAGAIYSVLLCWLILNLMESFHDAGTDNIYDALRIFLGLCIVEFAIGFVASFADGLSSIQQIKAANTAPGLNLMPTYIFAMSASVVTALEYGLDIWLLHLAGSMLKELRTEAYSEGSYNAAKVLSMWCSRSLIILTISSTALNVAQLLFARILHNVDMGFHLPTVSIGLAFVLLATTRLLHQGKVLKEDNDLFI